MGCDRYGSDVFQTRFLFEPTICMRGAASAEMFYDTNRFTRVEAAPDRLVRTRLARYVVFVAMALGLF